MSHTFPRAMMAFALVTLGAASTARPEDLPRYKLAVGQELRYESALAFKHQRGAYKDETTWTFWVVRQNPGGGWRVVVKQAQKTDGAAAADERLAWFDLSPDGRFARNDSLSFYVEPSLVFPPLPENEEAARAGWKAEVPFGGTVEYTSATPDAGTGNEFVIRAVQRSPEDEIYKATRSATIHFDPGRGLVSRRETHVTQDWGFHGAGDDILMLKSVETKSKEWVEQFDRESAACLDALRRYEEKSRPARDDPARADALLAEAEAALRAAREQVTLPELARPLDAKIAQHPQMVSYVKDYAGKTSPVLNKPAPDWSLTDLAGKPHRLADYRGKVVVLDWWYRGCGWCVRAMPQMNQVTEDFAGQPVAILGMNVDPKSEDARFVADKMSLRYGTLLGSRDLAAKYGVEGYPTLTLIDREGVVRDVHVGYSATLRSELGGMIRELLKGEQTRPPPAQDPALQK